VGRRLGELALDAAVEITGVRRQGGRSIAPNDDWRFEAGDAIVLLGRPSDLGRAEQRLLMGA
jgi:Trk K+ transport system NAD-binding subunit